MLALFTLIGLTLAAPGPPKDKGELKRLDLVLEARVDEEPEHVMELSFGSALLYVEQPLLDEYRLTRDSRVMPVQSVMMLAEWLVRPRWSVAGMVNIPPDPIRRVQDDGSLTEEHSGAALAVGGSFVPFQVRVSESSRFQPQVGLMAGRTINNSVEDRFFLLGVARLHLHTDAGFSMYLGAAFAGQRDTLAFLYGVGHRF